LWSSGQNTCNRMEKFIPIKVHQKRSPKFLLAKTWCLASLLICPLSASAVSEARISVASSLSWILKKKSKLSPTLTLHRQAQLMLGASAKRIAGPSLREKRWPHPVKMTKELLKTSN
jgi:hypothetical protein